MSEVGGSRPTDVEDLHWCDGGSAEDKVIPDSALRDNGYAPDAIPASQNFNWLKNVEYQFMAWLYATVLSEYSTLAEGIAGTEPPRSFRVHPEDTRMYGQYEQIVNVEGEAGAVAITDVVTDGQRIYYAQGNNVYAANPETGATLWTGAAIANTVVALAADGLGVYVLRSYHATLAEIQVLDPSDGTQVGSYKFADPSPSVLTLHHLAANGQYLAVTLDYDYDIQLHVFSNLTGNPTLVGHYDTLGNTNSGAYASQVCVDSTKAYVSTWQDASNSGLKAVNLSDASLAWSAWGAGVTGACTNPLTVDNDYVFIITGLLAGLKIYRASDGTLLDSIAIIDQDPRKIVIDRNYIYVSTDQIYNYFYDRRGLELVQSQILADTVITCTDALSIIGYDTNNIVRLALNKPTQHFTRVLGSDICRAPFFNLAHPSATL